MKAVFLDADTLGSDVSLKPIEEVMGLGVKIVGFR